ncbi:ATP-binding cassette domain-containing protein [Leptolyngbya sp. O-77]|uniref:ATP-binding cassette domain-containing protein n=1 Tax=Leptolyngbya sp. O-77 TaxID=1080068 RepID=UPI00074D49A3|nr:ATP-binding cassette domain-containing protein [Leptolyngbya sp. O-77]BAU40848.1 Lipopolysaccharide export system ATP-binding protein LptB [Leptolyngbya sp. O-77]
MALLTATQLTKTFGGIRAVDSASIEVPEGSITGLIGPNGAGKTTLFNLLSMFLRPDSGEVQFAGEPIQTLQPHQVAQRGLVRTFQVARVLSRLSVLENMLLAAQEQTGRAVLECVVAIAPGLPQEEETQREYAWNILESIGLAHKAHDYAGFPCRAVSASYWNWDGADGEAPADFAG